jgi:DNA-binding response OmpR family regulator
MTVAKPFTGRSVLVIEGDPGLRAAVSEALGVEGYVVQAVPPGPSALDLLDETNPGLLVMDPELRRWGHWTVPTAIRAHAHGIPLLALGANAVVRRYAEELLAEGYLDKPFALAELVLAVARMVG